MVLHQKQKKFGDNQHKKSAASELERLNGLVENKNSSDPFFFSDISNAEAALSYK
jgi:hypothetical protein